jgi:hypothetical protein
MVDRFSRPGETILSLESVESRPSQNPLNGSIDPQYDDQLYLLLGCESGNILTQDISKYLYMESYEAIEDVGAGDYQEMDDYGEEEKQLTVEDLIRKQQWINAADKQRY